MTVPRPDASDSDIMDNRIEASTSATGEGIDSPVQEDHAPDTLQVFISYRVEPDAPIASALKRLIEGAIEPQPKVFVAGDGGLRPSNVGFKQQLQTAARSAHAFVAIITSSSKDREWLFFEAGAAWGRDLMYAPVLVGPQPQELPSTIADYQALDAQSKEDMYKLLTSLAECVAAQLKERFGQRYVAFERTVQQYLRRDLMDDSLGIGEEIVRAFDMAIKGDIEGSAGLFEQAEERASDVEERCGIRVLRFITHSKSPQETLALLSGIDEQLRETTTFNYHMARHTQAPLRRSEFLDRAIRIGKGRYARVAQIEGAQLRFQLGETVQAEETLLTCIGRRPADELTEYAASVLVELKTDLSPFEKLLLHLGGLSATKPAGYQQIRELAKRVRLNFLNSLVERCCNTVCLSFAPKSI